jgi:hypothetical protein
MSPSTTSTAKAKSTAPIHDVAEPLAVSVGSAFAAGFGLSRLAKPRCRILGLGLLVLLELAFAFPALG